MLFCFWCVIFEQINVWILRTYEMLEVWSKLIGRI